MAAVKGGYQGLEIRISKGNADFTLVDYSIYSFLWNYRFYEIWMASIPGLEKEEKRKG